MILFSVDTSFGKLTRPVTVEAFDVDTTAADTLTPALLPLFRPDRAHRIGDLRPRPPSRTR